MKYRLRARKSGPDIYVDVHIQVLLVSCIFDFLRISIAHSQHDKIACCLISKDGLLLVLQVSSRLSVSVSHQVAERARICLLQVNLLLFFSYFHTRFVLKSEC